MVAVLSAFVPPTHTRARSDDEEELPLAQYFGISCTRFGNTSDARSVASVLSSSLPCLAVEFAWNAFDTWPLDKLSTGDECVLDTIQRAGVWSLVRKPLDTMWDGRPFRCVEVNTTDDVRSLYSPVCCTCTLEPKRRVGSHVMLTGPLCVVFLFFCILPSRAPRTLQRNSGTS